MKRYILLFAISVLAFASCSKDDRTHDIQGENGISLNVICSTMSPTLKAGISGEKPGEDEYNENIIRTIDYYFYPEGKDGEPAVLHARVSPNQLNQYSFNVPVDEEMINTKLFPRPSEYCKVAILVNYPGDHPAAQKLVDIQNLALVLQLQLNSEGKLRGADQSEFVMFGIGEITQIERRQTLVASLDVDVHRVAAKITLDAHVASRIMAPVELKDGIKTYILKQEWEPLLDQMYIYLENGNSNAIVSGDPAAVTYSFFKYDQREFSGLATHTITRKLYTEADYDADPPVYPQPTGETEEVTYTDFHKSKPFYTYPQTWATGSEHEPFLKLVLPWSRLEGNDQGYNPDWATKPHSWSTTQRQFYYRILFPNVATGFVSNNWYHINLDVAILGSDIDDATVDIEGKYYVVPWGSADPVTTDVKGARYLSVSKTVDTMYNTTLLKLPYVTSNECDIIINSVKQRDFSVTSSEYYTDYTTQARNNGWVTLDDNNNIVINHTLDNVITSDSFDAAPYTYSITIKHKDNNTYSTNITIVQYPAMYIEAETTTKDNKVFVNGTGSNNNSYAYPTGLNNYFLGAISDRSSVNDTGGNTNPRQYTVHVTVLNNTDWYLGDPRKAEGGTLSNLPVRTNPTATTGLYQYKPTADGMDNCIAPVFKVASSYGRTSARSYEQAVRRCAAYQENGYPAGRWRLPTPAEIKFLVTLSNNEKIPALFTTHVDTQGYYTAYWAAGKKAFDGTDIISITGDPTGNDTQTGDRSYSQNSRSYKIYTRCVYDVWYWGDGKVANPTQWAGYKD